jgi:hypothetical protein
MENNEAQHNPYLYEGLSADLASEREKLASMTGHLSLVGDRIKEDIEALQKEFKEAQISLEEQLSEGLRAASEDLSSKAFNMFKDKALSKAEEATSKLEKVADRTYSKMSDLTSASKISFRKLMILMSIGGILSGTIGALGYGFFFNKFYQVNPGTKQHLAWGSALEKSWPELTDREQDKLNKLLKENSP